MPSSYNAMSGADRERMADYYSEQPKSADLAEMPPALAKAAAARSNAPQNPHGQVSPDSNDPNPKKDGSPNHPQKDGSPNPIKKAYTPTAGKTVTVTVQ